MKAGYIYVLTHPSSPELYKIGVTVLEPKKRLAQHNRDLTKAAGLVVNETRQKWELKEFHAVPDPYWAEKMFWAATSLQDMPYRGGVEVVTMPWAEVERGLEAAKKAGLRTEQPPERLPDWVYANTAIMKKRLEGRGITLLTHVKSMRSGKSNFRCDNGHEWRTTPWLVAEGEGCPMCRVGQRTTEEIRAIVRTGIVCLLIHPDKPDYIKIGISRKTIQELCQEYPWGEWEIHRYRNTEEIDLAETAIWKLLGHTSPHNHELIKMDIRTAEDAMRKLHYTVQEMILDKNL